MTNETANSAVAGLIEALVEDAVELQSLVHLARGDMGDGSRNGAIGAMAGMDSILERMAAAVSASRAVHRAVR